MNELIQLSYQGSVAILNMSDAKNSHNPYFIAAFNQHLNSIEGNKDCKSVLLRSSADKNWSLGADVDWMSLPENTPQDIADFLQGLIQLIKRIISLPMPVIAEINGHAFGNGAVLACACDFRFMRSDKGYFCFPEVDLSIPFFPSMFPLILKAMPQSLFNRLAMTGQRVDGQLLLENQVVEAVFSSQEELMAGSIKFAEQFDKQRWIYGKNKRQMNASILLEMQENDPAFIAKMSQVLWDMLQA